MSLLQAVRNNDVAEVTRRVNNGAKLDEQDDDGWTPLHHGSEPLHSYPVPLTIFPQPLTLNPNPHPNPQLPSQNPDLNPLSLTPTP